MTPPRKGDDSVWTGVRDFFRRAPEEWRRASNRVHNNRVMEEMAAVTITCGVCGAGQLSTSRVQRFGSGSWFCGFVLRILGRLAILLSVIVIFAASSIGIVGVVSAIFATIGLLVAGYALYGFGLIVGSMRNVLVCSCCTAVIDRA